MRDRIIRKSMQKVVPKRGIQISVQPVVYGGAKNEQGNRDQAGATCQKKHGS